MDKQILFLLPLLIMSLFTVSIAAESSSSCPMDLNYVETFPWDSSSCRDPVDKNHCCQVLLSVIGIGLSQHLKQTSLFQLPNETISSNCLSNFQAKLTALSIDPSLVNSCFPNSSQFVTNSSTCAGIVFSFLYGSMLVVNFFVNERFKFTTSLTQFFHYH